MIENAIERVEEAMEDSNRLKNLKEINDGLSYSTKPSIRLGDRQKSENSIPRSNSASGRLGSSRKYSHVKPKTQTMLDVKTALNMSANLNESFNDVANDSSCLR